VHLTPTLICLPLAGILLTGPVARVAAAVDFSHDVVPILKEHCAECHTGEKKKGGLSMNDRASLLGGGENGAVVVPGDSAHSKLLKLVVSTDADDRMPPKGPRLSPEKVAVLKAWIDEGLPWQSGFAFRKPAYEPPLRPRRPELPPVTQGRTNPVDRILDHYSLSRKLPLPPRVDDPTFARRVHLDLIGLLPEPAQLDRFVSGGRSDKRARLVRSLLTNDVAYAEHWLSFWNDLLRNDYAGTGYIDDGRKQISGWLYSALVTNKPYDQFVRELIAPTPESEGFARGIKWRGNVSAGQTVPVQFAQSVGQSFLGINLKCASCHDSFIDRWKLEESYGLAAIYSDKPVELHRCDKPLGRMARPSWLFPELGQVNPEAPQPERLKQLAALMTHPENGRFTRTIVNRLWHRLMGRGIVHPTDAMQTEPWNADLLDFLAVHLADNHYDLKKTLELICTSEAYQSRCQAVSRETDEHGYVYAGPRARRLTAEQFVDALWQIGGTAPERFDAPVLRGRLDPEVERSIKITASWIWRYPEASDAVPKPGEVFTARKRVVLKRAPQGGGAVITADNSFTLFVNGQKAKSGDNWESPRAVLLDPFLRPGTNEFLVVAKNGGNAPNPAALFFEARIRLKDRTVVSVGSDATWEWTAAEPDGNGKFKEPPADWKPAAAVAKPDGWISKVGSQLVPLLGRSALTERVPVRASLLKSDLLMRTLGRPNREQIVGSRPNDLTTLEAIDLSNGQTLASMIEQDATRLLGRKWKSPEALIRWVYKCALSRPPTPEELDLAREVLGQQPSSQGVQDFLWAVLMLPEFQLVR
jgi:hypothetical protein